MNKLSSWLEKFLMPVAAVIGGQRHLGALRDGFIATLAINMTGAMAVLFNNLLFTPTSLIGKYANELAWYKDSVQPFFSEYFQPMMGRVWWATLAIITLFLVISISYSLAKSYDIDGVGAAIAGVASYFAVMPEAKDLTTGAFKVIDTASKAVIQNVELAEGTSALVGTWGEINVGLLGSNNMFLGIIVALVASQLFCSITNAGFTFKMPEQVPPAVAKAFAAILPAGITILLFSIIGVVFTNFIGMDLPQVVTKFIQDPLVKVGQSPIAYIGLVILAQVLWFFGLHGSNMIDPAMNTLYKPPLLDNIAAFNAGLEPEHILTRNFLDVYAMHGGSGATLALLIAIYFFSKKQEQRELFKLAIAPSIFQINEPVIFGLPMVLNTSFVIPFVIIPPICISIAYFFTKIGFAGKICVETPWVTPPVLGAFLATGFNWQAALVAAGTFTLSILIWIPFVIAANKEES